jgi:hypothetical protein
LALGAPVLADQVVYFINGKAIMVKSVEKGEKFTVLEMEGGGRIGVPTDQIARIEDYAISAPPAPQVAAPAPVVVQAPAAQPPLTASGGQIGIPSNLPPAPPMTPGPGVGGRPTTAPGQGIAGLRPLDVSGGATPAPGLQRPAPQANAGPAMGGPGGVFQGNRMARPNFAAGGRFAGRPGMAGRGGRPPEPNRYVPPPPPPAQSPAPTPGPPSSAVQEPPASTETEEPPPDPNEAPEPDPSAQEEGETPGDSPGGES